EQREVAAAVRRGGTNLAHGELFRGVVEERDVQRPRRRRAALGEVAEIKRAGVHRLRKRAADAAVGNASHVADRRRITNGRVDEAGRIDAARGLRAAAGGVGAPRGRVRRAGIAGGVPAAAAGERVVDGRSSRVIKSFVSGPDISGRLRGGESQESCSDKKRETWGVHSCKTGFAKTLPERTKSVNHMNG